MNKGEDILIVCLYVDDLIFMGSSDKLNKEFQNSMMQEFKMIDLGLMHYFIGMEIHQEENEIFICQLKYA